MRRGSTRAWLLCARILLPRAPVPPCTVPHTAAPLFSRAMSASLMTQYFKPAGKAGDAPAATEGASPTEASVSGQKRTRAAAAAAPRATAAKTRTPRTPSATESSVEADAVVEVVDSGADAKATPQLTPVPVATVSAAAASASASAGAGAAPVDGGSSSEDLALLAKAGVTVHASWVPVVAAELRKPYFNKLQTTVASARASKTVYPPPERVYTALQLTPLDQVKVVILGQDPYHGPGQAHGLSFSVPHGVAIPPSLRNILKETTTDVGARPAKHGNLEHWARQGVLLLNAVLTVEAAKANSHATAGWETFTNAIIQAVSAKCDAVVFLLWGNSAQAKKALINTHKHCVLEAVHPSPLSAHRGFLGCRHFSKANDFLKLRGRASIDWNLDA